MTQQNEMDGVRVVLSAPQLAAVLSRQSISQAEMMSNRLWDGLQILGGVLEMAGASVLCVAPEPTGLSKVGCVAFGVHGADTAAAGIHQIWTGFDTATLTYQGASKLAEVMKAPPEMADHIGLSLDLGVSFGVAGMMKAARVSSVRMGRISLMQHEAMPGSRIGGHTLLKHVGKTEAQMRARLAAEPKRSVVPSFTNQQAAEWAISEAMNANATLIKSWANSAGSYSRFDFIFDVGRNVGCGVVRESGTVVPMSKVKIILKYQKYNGMPYYILTSYLER
jgi:hypothetical protein